MNVCKFKLWSGHLVNMMMSDEWLSWKAPDRKKCDKQFKLGLFS